MQSQSIWYFGSGVLLATVLLPVGGYWIVGGIVLLVAVWRWRGAIALGLGVLAIAARLSWVNQQLAACARSVPGSVLTGEISTFPVSKKDSYDFVVRDARGCYWQTRWSPAAETTPPLWGQWGEWAGQGQIWPPATLSPRDRRQQLTGQWLSTAGQLGAASAATWVAEARQWGARKITGFFSPAVAGFFRGLWLGESTLLRTDQQAFRRTGLMHFVVVSGSHLSILMGILLRLLGGLAWRWRGPVAGSILCLYICLVGASAAALRAGLMAGLVLLATMLGRPAQGWRLLWLTIILMLLINPYWLLADLGWQLSVAATLGVVVVAPWVRELLPGPGRWWKEVLAITLAAQWLTFPLVITSFGEWSYAGLVANLLIEPFGTPLVGGGLLFLLVPTPANGLIGLMLEYLARLLLYLVRQIAVVPTLTAPFTTADLGWLYLIVAAGGYGVFWVARRWGYSENCR